MLHIGEFGEGHVEIVNGGQATGFAFRSVAFIAYLGFAPGSSGSLTVDGVNSLWSSDELLIGGGGSGTVSVTAGGTVDVTAVTVGALGEIRGDGSIVGYVQNGGLVSPGTSPGSLDIAGDYLQTAAGELLIELASVTSYDQLLVTGEATLGGALTVNLLDGFTPSVGQAFTILMADDVDDAFTIEALPSVPGLIFDVIYNPQSVVLTVSPAFTADFDEDGDVDAADLAQWQRDFGANALSDADADGDSDGDDFLRWQRQLGSPPPATAYADAVPEPGSAALLSAALLPVLAQVRRLHRSSPMN